MIEDLSWNVQKWLSQPVPANWMPERNEVVAMQYLPDPIIEWMVARNKLRGAADQLGFVVKRIPPDLIEVRVAYPKRLVYARTHTETYLLRDLRPIPIQYQEDIERYLDIPPELRLSFRRRTFSP